MEFPFKTVGRMVSQRFSLVPTETIAVPAYSGAFNYAVTRVDLTFTRTIDSVGSWGPWDADVVVTGYRIKKDGTVSDSAGAKLYWLQWHKPTWLNELIEEYRP